MSGRPVRAVIFDFDGTLTRPDAIDFTALRAGIGVPPGVPILEHIDSLPSAEERIHRHRLLQQWEDGAARASLPNEGAEEIIALIRERGLRLGILTRNTRRSLELSMGNFRRTRLSDFPVIVTREAAGRPKPHPDGVYEAAARLGVTPAESLVVGDFIFDIAAGQAAGARTVLITNGADGTKSAAATHARIGGAAVKLDATPDHVIARLAELAALLGQGH
jgi:hydrogenase expression/formation protein HypE